ncbi:DMT family transporter [Herbivorax sp. ANBcel31]|uniref:DMT family transporter n=1 Tax=Herbivorax sp. ANBcel31 TaxID=3069754 RepID=UPI0027B3BB2A|nr:DMT family transporter [Herbivorax sp. ANBcel31]MDQ2085274.1 DMT family transporter [Herbivorax sp. ANBcel31]
MKKNGFGYLFLLNTVILFSTYEVVSKIIIDRINPFQINFLRFFLAGLFLFLCSVIKGDIKVEKKHFKTFVILGILNVIFSMNLFQLSLSMENAKAALVAVIFSSNPIFVTLFSAIIDKEKIHTYKKVGLILGITGIAIMSFNELSVDALNVLSPLLAMFSAVLYGLYTVIGRKVSYKIGSLKMNSYSFLIGSVILLPFLIFFNIPVFDIDSTITAHVIYLSILVTGVGYLTYFIGLSIAGACKGSMVFFLKPVLASIFAVILLKEHAGIYFILGTILVVLGVIIIFYWEAFKHWIKNIKF